MKIILKIISSIIALFIFVIAVMAIFHLCPPNGHWIMPPWCEKVITQEKKDNDVLVDISRNNDVGNREMKGAVILGGDNKTGDNIIKNDKNIKTNISSDIAIDLPQIIKKGFEKGIVFGGMKWSSSEKKYINQALNKAQEYGVNWISIVPEWFVTPDVHGVEIKPYYSVDNFPNKSGWITPTLSDEELVSIIIKAKQRGMKVVLKPQIDPIDFGMKSGSSRGSLSPSDWDQFFSSYENFILHYAGLAQNQGVEMLIIGTELDTVVREMPSAGKKWRSLISKVRKLYKGSLTYSSSCFGECWSPRQVTFWDALDYIGFEPYFSVTSKDDPSKEEMKIAFDSKLNKFAKSLYSKYNKPVIITEANVYSYDGVNKHPLDAPSANAKADFQEQADYYDALMESITEKNWINGIYWWGWYLSSTVPGDYSKDLYDPFVYKKAGSVLKSWYTRLLIK